MRSYKYKQCTSEACHGLVKLQIAIWIRQLPLEGALQDEDLTLTLLRY